MWFVVRIVSNEEFSKVLKAPVKGWRKNKLRDMAVLHLLYCTGMRTGEVCSMKVSDVEDRTVTIIDSKKKTRNSLPISSKCSEVLKEYLVVSPHHRCYNGWLFPSNSKRGHIGLRMVEYIVKKHSPDWHPRTFRRRFARNWVIKKGCLTDLQRILRHKRLSSTSTYIDNIRFDFEEEQLKQEYSRIMED